MIRNELPDDTPRVNLSQLGDALDVGHGDTRSAVPLEDVDVAPPPSAQPLQPVTDSHEPEIPSRKRPGTTQLEADAKKRSRPAESLSGTKPQTAEEYNRLLLSNPRVRETSAVNPDFLTKFFSESRLHHLSIWKSALQSKIQQRMAEQQALVPASASLRKRRYVMHVDFDCFFAAVSLVDHPELQSKPVAITHGNATSSTSAEIASCNYIARSYGVKNGSWLASAKELCPDLVCLGYDYEKYTAASKEFYQVILSLRPEAIKAVSIDEALLDITNLVTSDHFSDEPDETATASRIAISVRDQIRERTKCEVSIGIAPNILLAKLALRHAKPAGQHILAPSDIATFLAPLSMATFPGIGKHTTKKLHESFGADTISELLSIPEQRFRDAIGPKTGTRVYEYCRGIDRTQVSDVEIPRQSISVDVNWGIRFYEQSQAETFTLALAEEVGKRMEAEGAVGKTLTLKVAKRAHDVPFETEKFLGCGKCEVVNRSWGFNSPTRDADVIGTKAVELLRACRISPGELRGIGLAMRALDAEGKVDTGQRKLQFAKAVPNTAPSATLAPRLPVEAKPRVGALMAAFSKTAAPAPVIVPADPELRHRSDPLSSVDPSFLAALPEELRAEILAQQPPAPPPPSDNPQLDPEFLAALPPELRDEILAQHSGEQNAVQQDLREQPPSPEFDVDTWNEFPQDLRDTLRREYESPRSGSGTGGTNQRATAREPTKKGGKIWESFREAGQRKDR